MNADEAAISANEETARRPQQHQLSLSLSPHLLSFRTFGARAPARAPKVRNLPRRAWSLTKQPASAFRHNKNPYSADTWQKHLYAAEQFPQISGRGGAAPGNFGMTMSEVGMAFNLPTHFSCCAHRNADSEEGNIFL